MVTLYVDQNNFFQIIIQNPLQTTEFLLIMSRFQIIPIWHKKISDLFNSNNFSIAFKHQNVVKHIVQIQSYNPPTPIENRYSL